MRCIALCLALAGLAQPAAATVDISAYLSSGFRIAAKKPETRTKPGAPPYQNLTRHLLVTRYTLERGDERVKCVQTYDSQQETLETDCR